MKSLAVSVLVLNFICAVYATVSIDTGDFKITTPSSTVEFNRITDTAITCEVALKNSAASPVALTGVQLFLSPNTGLTGAISDPISFTAGAPTSVPANADGSADNGLTTGMTAAVKVSDGTKCAAYNNLCIKVSWGTDSTASDCTTITTDCDFIAFKAGSFEITSPTTYTFNRVTATAITFKAGFVNDQATDTTVTSTKLYLSDKDDLDAADAKVSDPIDVTGGPTSVPANANGDTTGVTSDMTASVQILKADNCAQYDKLCIKVVPGSVLCIALTSKDCSALAFKDRTFTITAPATYKLNRTKATTLTFNAALVSIQTTEVTLTSYKLHLSDNADLSATGAKVSEAIDVTDAPTKVPANADGSSADKGLTNGMTSAVKIESAEDCSAYKWACLKVEPGPATGCVDVTGKTDCTDSGADFQKLSLFAVLLILLSVMLPFMG